MTDEITKAYIEAWGAKDVPRGVVAKGTFPKGTYPVTPMLGWVEPSKEWPTVGLHLSVLRRSKDKSIGSLTLGMPLTPKTERHVCCFLEELGWDGRVWPYKDHGWPEGTEHERGLLTLLRNARLGATFIFPETPDLGYACVDLHIPKVKGSFQIAPFGELIIPRHLPELRVLANDPTPFRSDWK